MSSKPQFPLRSLADSIVRYDLIAMRAEVRIEFNPETGSQRLLKQSEISARFRKKAKPRTPAA
jgi:hypothetical protein